MKKRSLFKSVASVMMFMTLALTSCVQGDLYDDFIDDDMSSSSMISRRKFKNDGGSNPELEAAKRWIDNEPAGEGECIAVAIKNYIGTKTLPEVRKLIGPDIYGAGSDWQCAYSLCVNMGGIPGSDMAANLIKKHCKVTLRTNNEWVSYQMQHTTTDQETGIMTVTPSDKIIVQVGGQHWGILTKMQKINGSWQKTVQDQHGSTTVTNQITTVLW